MNYRFEKSCVEGTPNGASCPKNNLCTFPKCLEMKKAVVNFPENVRAKNVYGEQDMIAFGTFVNKINKDEKDWYRTFVYKYNRSPTAKDMLDYWNEKTSA